MMSVLMPILLGFFAWLTLFIGGMGVESPPPTFYLPLILHALDSATVRPIPTLMAGGYATGLAETPAEIAWMKRFRALEAGGITDPLPPDQVRAFRLAGVHTLFLYEWMPASYHYLDGEPDDPFMQWAYAHRDTATLNPHGPFPHCQENQYDWCEDYYFDLALPEVRQRRVDYLAQTVAQAGYDGIFFDWASGVYLEDPAYDPIRQTYQARHPDLPYSQAVALFYHDLKDRGLILHTNQGFRRAAYILPLVHYDMTESYVTTDAERGHELYLQGQGRIPVPETLYYPLSDNEYQGHLEDTIDYLNYLADLRRQYAGPDFVATVYMNYAAPDFIPTGERIQGQQVYTATIPRNAIFLGYAIPKLLNQIAYTETPWDHRYERDPAAPYFYDLGDPLGETYETREQDGITYYIRFYTRGWVLAGAWPGPTQLTLTSPYLPARGMVYDAYEGGWLSLDHHTLPLSLRPQPISPFNSHPAPLGRVYLYAPVSDDSESSPHNDKK